MAEDESTYLKLPVEERCTHKIWKARLHGYEEVVKLFNNLDGDDEKWRKFHGLIKKFVVDINVVAQEKGLLAALAYSEKLKTKGLAGQICLMFCEIETHDKVIEELLKGLSQKNPKTVAGYHRDKGIREECKKLIIESYRWVGEIMKTQLTGLKPVQLTELETEFEKLENVGKAKPERLIRSQQAVGLIAGDGDGCDGVENGGEGGAESDEEAIDPYDLIEPVDILQKIPKNFFELVEEKKWQSRKEALDVLLPLTKTPKIVPGDFNEIIRVLKKFITKDTNVMLVAIAAQCIAGIAKGLRSSFKQGAVILLPACIETIQEDLLASLKHKTPSVNAESAKYLARCFAKCPPLLVSNKKLLKSYVTALLDKLSVSDPIVRESCSEALGVLMKFLGESSLMKFMPDLDNIKLSKIKEFCEKAELSGKSAAQLQAAPPKAKIVKPLSAPKAKIVSAASSSNDINKDDSEEVEEDFAVPKKPLSKKATQKKVVKSGKKPPSSDGDSKERKTSSAKSRFGMVAAAASNKKKNEEDTGAPYVNANLKNSRFKEETKFKVLKWNFTTPRPDNRFTHQYLPKDLDGLKDNLDLILKWLTLRFFETSPSVLMKGLRPLSFIPYLVNKVGDPKEAIRNSIKEILKIMSQVYAANKLVNFFMNGLLSKNSKQRAECLDELAHLIKGYGISVLQPSPSNNLKEVAKQISDRDTSVRNAAMNTIAEAYFQEGEKMYKMIGNLPEKDMTMLEERIKRASKTRQPNHQKRLRVVGIFLILVRLGLPLQDSECHNNQRSKVSPGRPVSGAFTLNYEEIEAVSEYRMSDSPPPPNHYNSIGNTPLTENNEVYEAIDLVLSQVFSLDTMTALNALTQLDDVIKDSEKVKLIINRLDQFIVACYNKYKHVLFTMMPTDNCNQKDVVKLFQFTTMALMSLYHRSDITKNTSLASLHDLIEVMINILTEPKVHELPGSSPLIKAMNLLKKSVPTSGLRPKFADLVMKCLWKIIRSIDQWMPQLHIDILLAELHEFLKAYPQTKGPDIMNHLGKISDPENSDLVPYLQKLMNCVVGTNEAVESREIFKKIGQKEMTKQGLEELYNFKTTKSTC
ncbi:CKAP5 [Lepeophtheirus salmonis]|uniref:CKAP5 n=1 Tax=Lepeophtheirus salmonis TaxID=72036 RepID=A0A7R8GYM5_LEPSM|nr:CKAP5 [Lepeophtheirus salmonis]CAF2749316.1 CKAP5 [Lepeophtheirus salmonis]